MAGREVMAAAFVCHRLGLIFVILAALPAILLPGF